MKSTLLGMGARMPMLSCKTMHDVQQTIEALLLEYTARDCLLALDIDMTLLQPDHPAVYYPNLRAHQGIYKNIMATLDAAARDRKATLTVQILPQRLVEAETPAIVAALQAKGIPTLAFTASLCGPMLYTTAKIASTATRIEALRSEILGRFGFDFAGVFETDTIRFDEIPAHNGQHPIFFKGILCANGEQGQGSDKGSVLVAFIKRLQLSPKMVVLVDDRIPNLEAVDRALKQYDPNIQFLGIEYQGAFEYAPSAISEQDFKMFWEDFAGQARSSVREK